MTRTPVAALAVLAILPILVACSEGAPSAGPEVLQLYTTCGDPVCAGHRPEPGLEPCTDELPGDLCAEPGEVCDLVNGCNVHLTCAASDPKLQPGGCPISRASAKRAVHYLDAAEQREQSKAVLSMRLARWAYTQAPVESPLRLGFLIDDLPSDSPAVLPNGEQVDLYGFASMAVATIQEQDRLIRALTERVEQLEARLEGTEAEAGPRD